MTCTRVNACERASTVELSIRIYFVYVLCAYIVQTHFFSHIFLKKGGKENVFYWGAEKSFFFDVEGCKGAARTGNLALLKYIYQNSPSRSVSLCRYAAKGGHLEVLKWAVSIGCGVGM